MAKQDLRPLGAILIGRIHDSCMKDPKGEVWHQPVDPNPMMLSLEVWGCEGCGEVWLREIEMLQHSMAKLLLDTPRLMWTRNTIDGTLYLTMVEPKQYEENPTAYIPYNEIK